MYITDLSAITPQKTFEEKDVLKEYVEYNGIHYKAIEPDYSSTIPRSLLRRMGKAVRLGIGVGLNLVNKHNDLCGIIIGTANGGLEDCFKFLDQIVEYNEGRLTPTNFVQSTPNAVAGQLAMMSKNQGYNITYTNGGHSFEDTILDVSLQINEKKNKFLIGGIEEISESNYNLDQSIGIYKEQAISNTDLLQSNTQGSICGEGASMFVVEHKAKDYYARIIDVDTFTYPEKSELLERLETFLKKNNLSFEDIDNLVLGRNGDIRHEEWYQIIEDKLPNTNVYAFKNYVGEYRTSTSFAVWQTCHILKGIQLPKNLILKKAHNKNNVSLIYNHFNEIEHSFILMSK